MRNSFRYSWDQTSYLKKNELTGKSTGVDDVAVVDSFYFLNVMSVLVSLINICWLDFSSEILFVEKIMIRLN